MKSIPRILATWLRPAWLALAALLLSTAPGYAYHYPWDQGHDTTTAVDPPKPGPDDRSCNDPEITCSATRSPVYASTGQAYWTAVDMALRGRPFIGIYRVYNSSDPVVGLFGNGWAVDFDVALYPALAGSTAQRIYKADNGKRHVFVRQADGSFKAPDGRFETVTETAAGAVMTTPDGQRQIFSIDGRVLQRIDSGGKALNFSYDTSLRLTNIADTSGRSVALTYNTQGLVASVTDHSGRAWRYAYDANGSLVSVTDPLAGVTRYTWQPYKPAGDAQTYYQLLSVTDPSGVVQVSYTYSGNQVSSYTYGADRISYSRNFDNTTLAGTVTQRDATGVSTTFDYGPLGLVTRDVNGLGGVTRYAYDGNGRVTQVTDASGKVWASTYDSLGRTLTSTNPLGQVTSLQYGGTGPRPTRITSPMGRATTMTYDTRGYLNELTDPAGAVTRASYDAVGNLTSSQNTLGERIAVEYSVAGIPLRVVSATGQASTMTLDTLGRVTAITNPAGQSYVYRYDALDRTISVVDPLNQTATFAFDAAGRQTSFTDPKGSVTRFEYDSFGRRNAEVAPDGRRTTIAYRTDNLISQITGPDGTTIRYDYDANKRLTRETAGSEVTTFTYDTLDRLTSASGPGGSVTYTYDDAGRVLAETSNGRTTAAVLNADGERTRLDYLGQTMTYSRDPRGQVSRIAAPAGNFDFTYDGLMRRTQMTFPNGSAVRTTYSSAGDVTGATHTGPFNASYGLVTDAVGRITRLSGEGADWNYSYDAMGRLTQAVQGAASFAYTLDPVGNMLGTGRTHDANHRLTADATKTYGYDQRGNLTLEQTRSTGARVVYTWNVKNQLTRVDFYPAATGTVPSRTLQFTYDPLGRRASKTDAGVVQRFVYDGDDLIGTLDGSNNVVSVNLFGGEMDEPLSTFSAGTHRFLHANPMGSIVAITQGGTLTHGYRYGPYGETLSGSSADSTPFRYIAREKDTDSLYHFRARYLSTTMQRFVSADPWGLAGGVNPYAYVGGDPINAKDPTGLFGPVGFAGGAGFEYVMQVWGKWDSSKTWGETLTPTSWTQITAAGAVGALVPKPAVEGVKALKAGYYAVKASRVGNGFRWLINSLRGTQAAERVVFAGTCQLVRRGTVNENVKGDPVGELGAWLWSFVPSLPPAPAKPMTAADWERRGSLGGHRW